jgi:hypothetical protein
MATDRLPACELRLLATFAGLTGDPLKQLDSAAALTKRPRSTTPIAALRLGGRAPETPVLRKPM